MLRFDITAVVLVACLFNFGDAQITAWSAPSEIASTSGSATGISKAEDVAVGETIAQFTATPTGDDTIASYELLTANTPFAISTPGGLLTLSTALDFETTTSYTIEVKATDSNTPANSATATLVITITDVNETPAFGATSYTVCVTDGLAAETSVTTFSATDGDGDTITYSINSGDTNTDFKIATAELQVNTGKTLERATTATYTLVVHAADDDSPSLTGSATYTINVQTSCNSGAAALTMTFITLFLALISSLN